MVRGWAPAVEEALAELVGASRATRLAITYLDRLSRRPTASAPPPTTPPTTSSAARRPGGRPPARDVRLYRRDDDPESRLRLKIYRLGGLIPLSDVVPVLENFGFRVLEEMPTRLENGERGYIHDFAVDDRATVDGRAGAWRAPR